MGNFRWLLHISVLVADAFLTSCGKDYNIGILLVILEGWSTEKGHFRGNKQLLVKIKLSPNLHCLSICIKMTDGKNFHAIILSNNYFTAI